MKPIELSVELNRIASAIARSKNPNREHVLRDLSHLVSKLAAVGDNGNLSPEEQVVLEVNSFAAELRTWNLKYDAFPNIKKVLDRIWTTGPESAKQAAEEYLNAVIDGRASGYHGAPQDTTALTAASNKWYRASKLMTGQ
jgi:hypothetical protein